MKTDVQKKSSENKKLKVKTSQRKERIAWIDIAKGVTILTVIWSHTLPFGGLPRNLIFCFHMPLFFILSGFTLKPARDVKDLVLSLLWHKFTAGLRTSVCPRYVDNPAF